MTGTDLLRALRRPRRSTCSAWTPPALGGIEDLAAGRELHDEMARRRVYLHPIRWTSLGLSLLEAMHLGMPVVALGTTEAAEAVPPEAGVISTRLDVLRATLRAARRRPRRGPRARASRPRARRSRATGSSASWTTGTTCSWRRWPR